MGQQRKVYLKSDDWRLSGAKQPVDSALQHRLSSARSGHHIALSADCSSSLADRFANSSFFCSRRTRSAGEISLELSGWPDRLSSTIPRILKTSQIAASKEPRKSNIVEDHYGSVAEIISQEPPKAALRWLAELRRAILRPVWTEAGSPWSERPVSPKAVSHLAELGVIRLAANGQLRPFYSAA